MSQDIRPNSPFNTLIPALADSADIVKAFKDYHYGTSNYPTDTAAENGSSTGIVGLFNKKANLSGGATFTGTIVLPSTTSIGDVSNTEISYLDGVTSSIQTQINALAPKASPQFTGIVYSAQGAPTSLSDAAQTLTWANLQTLILTSTPTAARTWTLPQATTSAIPGNDLSFNWTIINLATTAGRDISLVAATGHTIVGSLKVAAASSASFKTRKIDNSNYITYRI